jgi:hypothetical protein
MQQHQAARQSFTLIFRRRWVGIALKLLSRIEFSAHPSFQFPSLLLFSSLIPSNPPPASKYSVFISLPLFISIAESDPPEVYYSVRDIFISANDNLIIEEVNII